MRKSLLLVAVVLAVGLLLLFWGWPTNSKRIYYEISSEGRMCEVGNKDRCRDLVSDKGAVAVPYCGAEADGVAVMRVEDGAPIEVVVRAMNHFAENGVARFIFERKDGGPHERFRCVAALMGIQANGPARWAMDHAPPGYFDGGGMVRIEGFRVLSVEVMDDRLFFGTREVTDEEVRKALDGVELSVIRASFRKGSHLGGVWRLTRLRGNRDVEIVPYTTR
ncbi:MAG: hypothetical protein EOP87_18525 [Verrucomicrobiaceae bacterium]|nr:MAG: hypothetical protein EOP87_18525 [Verrucomicrobiaceae bacterium]